LLKFALCYGFRNLQNVVRKIKTGKCDYHFLEIMACPSGDFLLSNLDNRDRASYLYIMALLLKTGCLNGGGQIKPKPGQSPKDLIELLEAAYQENVSTFMLDLSFIASDTQSETYFDSTFCMFLLRCRVDIVCQNYDEIRRSLNNVHVLISTYQLISKDARPIYAVSESHLDTN